MAVLSVYCYGQHARGPGQSEKALGLSLRTVEAHRGNPLTTLEARNLLEVVHVTLRDVGRGASVLGALGQGTDQAL